MMNIDLSSTIASLLGDAAANYNQQQLADAGMIAWAEVESYCRRKIEEDDMCMLMIICRIAAIRLQRIGTESVASQSFSGVSESFIDGYPADIKAILDSKRKIKVVG